MPRLCPASPPPPPSGLTLIGALRPRAVTAKVSCRSHANSSPHTFFAIPFRKALFFLEDEVDVSRRGHRRSAPTERYGLQGRPRVVVTQQQLQTLHELCGFRWNDIAETLGVSDRTLQRRRHEYGMRVEGREFSSLSDAELDDIVRNIHSVAPEAGLLMVQGSLRQHGRIDGSESVMHSLRRVDSVTSALRNARRIIRGSYNVPSPNSLW